MRDACALRISVLTNPLPYRATAFFDARGVRDHGKRPSDMQRSVPSARCFCCARQTKRNEPRHGGRGPRFPTEDERVLAARSSRTLSECYARGNAADMAATGSVTAANTIGTEVVALQCHALGLALADRVRASPTRS